jgi:hypothetical protein
MGRQYWNIYKHCPASTDHGLGCLRVFLVRSIQVPPSVELPVDWVCSGLGGGGADFYSTLFHTELGWAEIHCTPASFAVYFTGSSGLSDNNPSVGHSYLPIRCCNEGGGRGFVFTALCCCGLLLATYKQSGFKKWYLIPPILTRYLGKYAVYVFSEPWISINISCISENFIWL